MALGDDAVFSCKTHKALREFTSWVRLTGSEIVVLAEGTEVLRIHNVTESDLVRFSSLFNTTLKWPKKLKLSLLKFS